MTSVQPENLGNRMDRLEATLRSAGDLLLQASALAQRNTENIQRNAESIQALTQRIDGLAAASQSLAERLNSLTAASERHDRILDYLLRKETENPDES
ncbi:MAG: hypothetical protein F6J97_21735 [Leptolyngbya sp. SIO4C1]|nr:hypothetical protein [Leptolyngbya sp. SIO4C1]